MKKYLIALLYVFIFSFASFTNVKTETYYKIENVNKTQLVENKKESIKVKAESDNTVEESNKEEQEVIEEQEETTQESTDIIQTSAEAESAYIPAVTYGTYGRLYVSGFSVALYDYNVNTNSSLSLQTIVDNWDSAAYYRNRGRLVIADHDNQGFSVLTYLSEGTTAYIQFEDGSTIGYRLIKKSSGYNTGPDLVDTEGNSFFSMYSDLIMYTCYDGGIMATLWVLE